MQSAHRRPSLWLRHAQLMASVACAGVLVLGAVEMVSAYRAAMKDLQSKQAQRGADLAASVRLVVSGVERQVIATNALPWEIEGWLTETDRRHEFARLMKVLPIVESISLLAANGAERLRVHRRSADVWTSDPEAGLRRSVGPVAMARPVYSRTRYEHEGTPSFTVQLGWQDLSAARTVVEINLMSMAEELSASLKTPVGDMYVLDREDRVILHRDAGVMLERRTPADVQKLSVADGLVQIQGLDGGSVFATATPLEGLGWKVIVEEPREVALQAVSSTIVRTGLVTALVLALSICAALLLARRLADPIVKLSRGATRLGEGDLGARIQIDAPEREVAVLVHEFNKMASTLQDTITHQEQRIAEKTQALERANRNKTEFLANMSHELRTPLQAVIGFADSLRNEQKRFGALTSKQDEYLGEIHRSGVYLVSLINDLLDLNKVEAGQMELEPVECDIAAVVERSRIFVKEAALSRRLGLSLSIEPPNLCWRADPRRLKQILINLLANAVKFTDAGSVSVHARVEGDELWIEVRDTGRGIAPQDLPHLCEPFRQMSGSVPLSDDRAIEGTGLGLALVRQLAQLHGGTLEWQSEVGVGSLFRIRLPKDGPP